MIRKAGYCAITTWRIVACVVQVTGKLASVPRRSTAKADQEVRAYTLTFVNVLWHDLPGMSAPLALLGVTDLAVRWNYTRQGVHQLAGRSGFPTPAATVNSGRVRVWLVTDIEAFEQGRPELGDEVAKRRKQRGYYQAQEKAGQGL